MTKAKADPSQLETQRHGWYCKFFTGDGLCDKPWGHSGAHHTHQHKKPPAWKHATKDSAVGASNVIVVYLPPTAPHGADKWADAWDDFDDLCASMPTRGRK